VNGLQNRRNITIRKGLKRYAPQAGLEPARPEEDALTVRCSTNYAYCGAYRSIFYKMVAGEGFEPPSFGL